MKRNKEYSDDELYEEIEMLKHKVKKLEKSERHRKVLRLLKLLMIICVIGFLIYGYFYLTDFIPDYINETIKKMNPFNN